MPTIVPSVLRVARRAASLGVRTLAVLTLATGLLLVLKRARPAPAPDRLDSLPPIAAERPRLAGAGLVAVGLLVMAVALLPGGRPDRTAIAVSLPLPPAAIGEVAPQPVHMEQPLSQSLAYAASSSIPVSVQFSAPFIWPAIGDITSEIGPLHPNGIDIGLDLNADEPIRATARGWVKLAGGGRGHEYGFHVVIDHGGDIESLYAHLERVAVQEGDFVRQGDVLGLGGSTGHSDGKHLHFEIRSRGQQINPLQVLPRRDLPQPGAPLNIDCAQDALVIDSGAPMLVDFASLLVAGSKVSSVSFEAVNASSKALPAVVTIEDDTTVLLDTSPTVTATGADDEYLLTVIPNPVGDRAELSCTVFVRTRTVRTVFYVRPTPTPAITVEPQEYGPTDTPATRTPTPFPTPSPTPTATATPFGCC